MSFFKKIVSLFKKEKTSSETKPVPIGYTGQSALIIDTLTDHELNFCRDAGLTADDGLFLKKLTRRPLEKFEFESFEDDNLVKPSGICSLTSEEKARDIIIDNLQHFIAQGKYIFISDLAYNGYKVAVVNNPDPYAIMKYAGTNGLNYDITTEDIIAKYKKWDSEFGIRIIGIGPDFCECQIVNTDIDYPKLAEEVYEFCSDVVEQGTETVEKLAEEMEASETIYLWWD
jgi:hypothetical protein